MVRPWLLGIACGTLMAQTVSFIPRGDFPAGLNPSSVVTGDFNGDGTLDLAVANDGFSSNISILLGLGSGLFRPFVNVIVGDGQRFVAVADFDNDGRLDLAVANANSASVSVLRGNGTGTFLPPLTFPVGAGPASLAVSDFNGDGRADLAVACRNSNLVSVLLGTGLGTFQRRFDFAVESVPRSIAVGDFDDDGIPDLVVANSRSNTVSVLIGLGDGTFRAALKFPAGDSPVAVAVGDFNDDGRLDVAIANGFATTVSVLRGTGLGTFLPPLSFPAGPNPGFLVVSDVNGDGNPDVVVANGGLTTRVSVLLGIGLANFLPPVSFPVGRNPIGIAVGDFNGDARPDLAVANSGAGSVTVLENRTGGGTSGITAVSAAGGQPVVAPGSIASILGSGLASSTQSAITVPLPTSLGGTTVEFTDSAGRSRMAPLFFVSPNQINFEVPAETVAGRATLSIRNGTATVLSGTAQVNAVAPGLFTADGSGRGIAAALVTRRAGEAETVSPVLQCGGDGACVSLPIDLPDGAAVYLSLFGTGLRGRTSLEVVTCTISGIRMPVLYAGPQGTFAGVDQVNLELQNSLRGCGETDVVLTVDGQVANVVRVTIR